MVNINARINWKPGMELTAQTFLDTCCFGRQMHGRTTRHAIPLLRVVLYQQI